MPAQAGEKRQCEKCETEIVFLRHAKTGKLAPIEIKPRSEGRFKVDWENFTYHTIAGRSKDGTPFSERKRDEEYHENHYLACPEAHFFRDRNRGGSE